VTWLADLTQPNKTNTITIETIKYDHVISKADPKDEDWKEFVNRDSMVRFLFLGILDDLY
jgi:hypothetical protein